MISCHDDHRFALYARQGALRDACNLNGDVFEQAKTSGRLCQLPLARSCSLHGFGIEGFDTCDSLKYLFHTYFLPVGGNRVALVKITTVFRACAFWVGVTPSANETTKSFEPTYIQVLPLLAQTVYLAFSYSSFILPRLCLDGP
jgi:hypothetical protein